MAEYRVWQKAIVWYQAVNVEAETPEQAVEIAKADNNLDWEVDLETTDLLDAWEVYDENDNAVLIINGGE